MAFMHTKQLVNLFGVVVGAVNIKCEGTKQFPNEGDMFRFEQLSYN